MREDRMTSARMGWRLKKIVLRWVSLLSENSRFREQSSEAMKIWQPILGGGDKILNGFGKV